MNYLDVDLESNSADDDVDDDDEVIEPKCVSIATSTNDIELYDQVAIIENDSN